MLSLEFDIHELKLVNDPTYTLGSSDNIFNYDSVYHDHEALEYNSSNHGVKLFKEGQLIKSAIVCAVGGATGIYENSAIIDDQNLLICCANKLFCLNLPDLSLNWMTETDIATCFGVYLADDGIFTYGEVCVTRLDVNGKIIWQTGVNDILVNIEDDKRCFTLYDNYIKLRDFNSTIYLIDFDGNFINRTSNDRQKFKNPNPLDRSKRKWWGFWNLD